MANQRNRRLMQEALDDELTQADREQLYDELDQDPGSTAEYQRLRQVDNLLRDAPFERAPQTLAMSIMARLAEGLKQQNLSHISGLALAVGLSLTTLVLLPLLISLSALFLNAIGSAAALAGLLRSLIGVASVVMLGLESVVQNAQTLIASQPGGLALLTLLVPVSAAWLARTNRDEDR